MFRFWQTVYCVCIFVNVWNADILEIHIFFYLFHFILNHRELCILFLYAELFVFCYRNDFDQFDFPTFGLCIYIASRISHHFDIRHLRSLLYMINTPHMFDIFVLILFLFSHLSLSIFAEMAALWPMYWNGWISWRSDQWYLIIFVVLVGLFSLFIHVVVLVKENI